MNTLLKLWLSFNLRYEEGREGAWKGGKVGRAWEGDWEEVAGEDRMKRGVVTFINICSYRRSYVIDLQSAPHLCTIFLMM